MGADVGVEVDIFVVLLVVVVAELLELPPGKSVAEKYTEIKIKLAARMHKPATINPSFVLPGPDGGVNCGGGLGEYPGW